MLNNEDIQFSDVSNMENVPNGMFLECFIGLTEVTKKSCCHGYQVTKEKQNGNYLFFEMSCILF